MAHTLEVIAAHQLEVPEKETEGEVSVSHVGAAPVARLRADAVGGLVDYVASLDDRDEIVGKAQAAWWDSAKPSELDELETCAVGAFDEASRAAMDRLRSNTPRSAASGVVLFLRGKRDGGKPFLALLKMSPAAVSHKQFHPGSSAPSAITIENLQDVLPEPGDLRKAAVLPNPSGAPVRVVDLQGPDPAGYWLRFLGVAERPRQKAVAGKLTESAVSALESEGVEQQEARVIVATSLAAAAEDRKPVEPRKFLDGVAAKANKDPQEVWDHAVGKEPELKLSHVDFAPAVVQKLTAKIDLGNRITLSGPAAQLDRYVTPGQDANGWFVKVRSTHKPETRTR